MGKFERARKATKEKAKVVTEATYDPDARRKWLTGFSKRKKERRLKGLAYGAMKARAEKLAERAARRAANPRPKAPPPPPPEAPAERSTIAYADAAVVDMWGAAVTVTTTLGLDVDSEDEERAATLERRAPAPPKNRVDTAQEEAGTLEAMKRKCAPQIARTAKAARRSNRKRDANPHRDASGGGGASAKSLVDAASGKKKAKRKRK
jgi:hypothetical protein